LLFKQDYRPYSESSGFMDNVYFKPCALSQVSRRCSWKFYINSKSTSWFLYNRPNGPLKASGCPIAPRSFSVKDVQTSRQHCLDARSSFSNFYTELDFNRHYLGSFCNTFGRRGNTSRRCPVFQNIPGFLYKREKELQGRPSGRSAKPSGRGPDMGRYCANLEGGRRRPSGRSTARVWFWAELGFL